MDWYYDKLVDKIPHVCIEWALTIGYTIGGRLKGSPVVAKKSHHWHFLDVPFSIVKWKKKFFYKNVMLFDGVHFPCQEINAFGQLTILINNKLNIPNWPASMIGPCVVFIEN